MSHFFRELADLAWPAARPLLRAAADCARGANPLAALAEREFFAAADWTREAARGVIADPLRPDFPLLFPMTVPLR